ncbi:MAG: prepilin peptidase [Candidatus Saccharibacteria bacterium]|nr:prepilin peptidase [Candidatus Saccharibacteria bacterium]
MYVLMFILGVAFGSFLCCQVRRLRLWETKKKKLGPRSVCEKCKYQLKWYDNLPIISWLILRGKCRKCGKKIGALEIISELAVGLSLLLLSTSLNLETATVIDYAIFIISLVLTLSLAFLAIYDGAYGELPVFSLTFSGICAIIITILKQWSLFSIAGFSYNLILDPILSALLFGGIYLILYLISKGKWVGDGDWILAGIIGLALGDPWLSLTALFIANFTATLIMYPLVRKKSTKKIYFGPFLVLAFILTYTFSDFFISML